MSLSKKTKILIGGGLVIVVLFLGLAGFKVWKLYSFYSSVRELTKKVEIPAELQETKVFKGAEFLTKKEFFKLEQLGFKDSIVKDLQIADEKERERITGGETAKGLYNYADIRICGDEIVAVGEFGGQVFDFGGNLKREIFFEPSVRKRKILGFNKDYYRQTLDNLRIIDIETDGKCEFISHSSVDGFALFDDKGNIMRRTDEKNFEIFGADGDSDKEVYVTEATVGDLDDDGTAEFIISRKSDGIRAYDKNFNEKWFQPDEFPTADLHVLDLDGDGTTVLLEFQGMSSTIRDKKTGNVLKKILIDGWQKELLALEDEKKKKTIGTFYINENKLVLSDLSDRILLQTEAPLSEVKIKVEKEDLPKSTPIDMGNGFRIEPLEIGPVDNESVYAPHAVWVTLKKDKPKYLVIVASFIRIPRSHFYVYAPDGKLVYHELLPEEAETMAVLPVAGVAEEILIGGRETIWKYAAN